MTHQEIEKSEIIERYVRHQLTTEERRAFQEHFFACAECFVQVQDTARFVAGVKQAARQGLLHERPAAAPWWAWLFSPAFGLAAAAGLALVIGWFWFRQSNAPEQRVAHQATPTPAPTVANKPELAATPPPKLQDQRDLLAQNRPPDEAPVKTPVVLLESSRDAGSSNQLTLPANGKNIVLRIEIEPGSDYSGFTFQIFDSARHLVTTGVSGKASARGSVTTRVSATNLQEGKYLVKCFGQRAGQRLLVGEYDLRLRKP